MSLIRWKPKCNDPIENLLTKDWPHFGLTLFPELEQVVKAGKFPALDVSEDKTNIVIKADLPGLTKEDVTLSLNGSLLTIRGERKSEAEGKDKNYHRIERSYGIFERSLDLGIQADQSKVQAKYKDGVLEIVVPKPENKAVKHIDIETT